MPEHLPAMRLCILRIKGFQITKLFQMEHDNYGYNLGLRHDKPAISVAFTAVCRQESTSITPSNCLPNSSAAQ
jgi:hypothetical protein